MNLAAADELRPRLRACGRHVGDARRANKTQGIDPLTQELAYEYRHRMLFARFLAENHLLMHPEGVPVSLADCDELARDEGAPNGFVLTARYAGRMLPQIFRTDDVLLDVELPTNDRLPLEKLLTSLPTYVCEFLLGRYRASTHEEEIQEGLQIVERQLRDRAVRSGEEEQQKLFDLSDDMATKVNILYFTDAREAFIKALSD